MVQIKVLNAIVKAVVSDTLSESGLAETVRKRLRLDPACLALRRAPAIAPSPVTTSPHATRPPAS